MLSQYANSLMERLAYPVVNTSLAASYRVNNIIGIPHIAQTPRIPSLDTSIKQAPTRKRKPIPSAAHGNLNFQINGRRIVNGGN